MGHFSQETHCLFANPSQLFDVARSSHSMISVSLPLWLLAALSVSHGQYTSSALQEPAPEEVLALFQHIKGHAALHELHSDRDGGDGMLH